MGQTVSPQSALVVISLLGLAVSAVIYGWVIRGLRRDGGLVQAGRFAWPDLLVALGLASLFGALVTLSVVRPEAAPEMTADRLFKSSLTLAGILSALVGYLYYRGFSFRETFGLGRVSAPRVVAGAGLLMVGAFPLVALAGLAAQQVMKNEAAEQELVKLFRAAAESGDSTMMLAVFFSGVIVAPIGEELLFRGFFYAVGKRFAGPWIGALATSVVFAAFHGNLASLAGLTVLALAFTLAYERTGSLAVPMTMHALFNGTSLSLLYLQATGRLGV